MPDKAKLEEEIRKLLVSDLDAVTLSNSLFSPPDGLFCRLGVTEEERRVIIQTPLFREAQHRITELQQMEREAFARALAECRNLQKAETKG
jgi:hypothetical protein